MKLKNVKPLDYNKFEMIGDILEITTYNPKTKQLIVYKVDDFSIPKSFTVDAKVVIMLKAMYYDSKDFELKVNPKTIQIKNSVSKFSSSYLDEINIPGVNSENLNVNETSLNALKKASKFVARNDSRPELTGVRLYQGGGIISTDSYRGYRYNPNHEDLDALSCYIIPTWFIDSIPVSKDEESDKVSIKCNDHYAVFENEDIKIYTNLIIGNIKNINNLFENARNQSNSFGINQDEITNIFSTISALVDKNAILKIECREIGNSIISLNSDSIEYSAEIYMPSFQSVIIGFTFDYLKSVIDNCNGSIYVAYKNEKSVFSFRENRPGYVEDFIVLPVRI